MIFSAFVLRHSDPWAVEGGELFDGGTGGGGNEGHARIKSSRKGDTRHEAPDPDSTITRE